MIARNEFEMIFCVVNAGYADTVMTALRQEGARGGTVIRARGTADKEAEKLFGITVQPEKDLLMLVVPVETKDRFMHVIYKTAGPDTPGQGITFSLPVDGAVGLKGPEPAPEQEDDETSGQEKTQG